MIRMTDEQQRRAQVARATAIEMQKPCNRSDCGQLLATLREQAPASCQGMVDRLANGSKAAAIKLHCLQCVGYERAEVAKCSSWYCPMWPFRPYQVGERI